jgi:hypothetical protein
MTASPAVRATTRADLGVLGSSCVSRRPIGIDAFLHELAYSTLRHAIAGNAYRFGDARIAHGYGACTVDIRDEIVVDEHVVAQRPAVRLRTVGPGVYLRNGAAVLSISVPDAVVGYGDPETDRGRWPVFPGRGSPTGGDAGTALL